MSKTKEFEFSLKVMTNEQNTKVLFAEADGDFADVLLSFLTLPLGTIVRVLGQHYGDQTPTIGSLTTLYNGLSNMESVHFRTESFKQMLLNPRNSCEAECHKLKLNVDDTLCKNFPSLGKKLLSNAKDGDDDGVFVKKTATFVISDDLRMEPVTGGVINTLSKIGIEDTHGAELIRNVTFRFNEIMDLLKGSLLSLTPLTDVILNQKRIVFATPKPDQPPIVLPQIEKEATSKPKKMILKLMLRKSSNKLLFAQADEDFVDFLFSSLSISLGEVECLLNSNTRLDNIDNLYWSIIEFMDEEYLRTPETKNKLRNPKLAPRHRSKKQILPLIEDSPSPSYFKSGGIAFKYPTLEGDYVKGPQMYMVTDDLTVTPFSVTSAVSVLNEMRIGLSDVVEVELHIGFKEALRILEASLTSSFALTDGLSIA